MKQGSTSLQCIRQVETLSKKIADSTNLYVPSLETRVLNSDTFFTASLVADNTYTIVSANSLKVTTANPVRTGYLFIDNSVFTPTPKQKYLLECYVYVLDTGANIAPFYTQSDLFPRYAPKIGIGIPPVSLEPTNEPVVFEVLNEWVGSEASVGKWTKIQTIFWAIGDIEQIGVYLHWENPTHPYPFEIWIDGFTLREYEVKSVLDSEITSEFELDTDANQDIALTYSITDFSVNDSAKNNFTKNINAIHTENNHANFDFFNSVSDNYNSETVKAVLKIEGIPIFEGELRLIETTSTRRHVKYNDSYSVYLKETSRAWAEKVQDKKLTELSYLDYQLFRVNEVVETFTNTSESYLTPNTGFLNSDHAVFPYFIYGDDSHDFYNETTPSINLNNLRPAFFVKTLIENIFKEAGYTVTFEGFTNTPEFAKLILPYCKEQFLHDIGYLNTYVSRECYYNNTCFTDYYLPNPPLNYLYFELQALYTSPFCSTINRNFDIHHSAKILASNNTIFYARTKGVYQFTIALFAEIDESLFITPPPSDYTIFSPTSNIGETYSYIPTPNKRGFIATFQLEFEQCETVQFFFGLFDGTSGAYGIMYQKNTETSLTLAVPVLYATEAEGFWNLSSIDQYALRQETCFYINAIGDHEIREGNNIFLNLNKQLPDLTQLEVLQGIESLYNLQFVGERGSNEIRVITNTDFSFSVDNAQIWTDKLDETLVTKKPVQEKATNYLSSYSEDSGDKALPANYGNDTYKNPYKVTSDNTDLTTTIFAPTYFESPKFWLTLPKASKFGLVQRILFYEGLVNGQGNSTFIQHSCPLQNFEVEGYPKASFLTDYNSLSFKTETINGVEIKGLRERFWQDTINLFLQGILFEAYFALNLLDILELDFGKPVQIKNEFYKLQSVNDFRASLDKLTKCVLVKIGAGQYVSQEEILALWESGNDMIFENGDDFLF